MQSRIVLGGREWGYVAAGDRGPALLLIPGTLGRGDVFWNQIAALQDRAPGDRRRRYSEEDSNGTSGEY